MARAPYNGRTVFRRGRGMLAMVVGAAAMVIRRLWGTRRVPIAEIDAIAEASGVSPVLRLTSGERIKLPDVAGHLGNSTRAWLRASREPAT